MKYAWSPLISLNLWKRCLRISLPKFVRLRTILWFVFNDVQLCRYRYFLHFQGHWTSVLSMAYFHLLDEAQKVRIARAMVAFIEWWRRGTWRHLGAIVWRTGSLKSIQVALLCIAYLSPVYTLNGWHVTHMLRVGVFSPLCVLYTLMQSPHSFQQPLNRFLSALKRDYIPVFDFIPYEILIRFPINSPWCSVFPSHCIDEFWVMFLDEQYFNGRLRMTLMSLKVCLLLTMTVVHEVICFSILFFTIVLIFKAWLGVLFLRCLLVGFKVIYLQLSKSSIKCWVR